MRYIQVSKALYDYEAQTDEELSIREGDTLYVVEKEDDDWWKAELKQPNSDEQGPVGLVPATYLEEMTPIGRVRAEYDYEAQQEEELSFQEDDEMDLLETDDPDWYLVKRSNGHIGLVPSNYVQTIDEHQASHEQYREEAITLQAAAETTIYTPPAPQVPITAPPTTQVSVPPVQPILSQRTGSTATVSREVINDDAQSWSVNEYDVEKKKKKKDKGSLFVGNGMLCYGSETDKSLPVQQYPILDVIKYLYDGKILHIEIGGTKKAVLDLQASSKSEAKAILAKISDSSRAAQMSNTTINQYVPERQIAAPAAAIAPRTGSPEPIINEPEPTCEPKWGISLYSFQAEGEDELSVDENEQIYVIDYERTDGWYRVQKTNGDTGIIPSTYVQFDDDDKAAETRRKEEERRRAEEEEAERRREEQRRREEEERRRKEEERRRQEEEKRRREEEEAARLKKIEEEYKKKEAERKAQLARSSSRKDLPKPDPSKIRTWTDRSGSFKVEAQFIDFHNGKLRLHKLNGVKIDVPVEKMSPEDVRWVEKYGQSQPAPAQAPPQKKLNERWDWFDWFMVIGIPMQASLQYASAFKAEKLDDSDIPKLTHRQMKTLGLKEDHVQRIQRYIETGVPEYYEDEENKKKQLQQDQIKKDEEYAKQLQKEIEQSEKSKAAASQSNGRPRPSGSTPKKEIHPDLLDFIGNQLTNESDQKAKQPEKPVNSDLLGFNDDAWAPRDNTSPVPPVTAVAPPPGPNPEQIKEQEEERKRREEEEQIRKIQLMGLAKQTRDQKQQLEELQKLTMQQLEIQKQIAMQTGSQQQQQMLQLQAQKQQLEQQQQIAQVTGFNPQPTGFNVQPTGFNAQPTGINPQPIGLNAQPAAFNSQPTGFSNQSNGISTPGSNGRPRPTPNNNLNSDPTLSQWQPTQQQQQQPQQTGFEANVFAQQQQPQQSVFQANSFVQQQQPQQPVFQPASFSQQPQQSTAWQGLQPQMTGVPSPLSPFGNGYQQAPVLQPSIVNGGIGVQPTGRNWNASTPANPFGSPLQAQMTGVPFSATSPQAYNQPLQAQMTGNNVFTPQGSMQYGQSAFPAQRPW